MAIRAGHFKRVSRGQYVTQGVSPVYSIQYDSTTGAVVVTQADNAPQLLTDNAKDAPEAKRLAILYIGWYAPRPDAPPPEWYLLEGGGND